MCRDDSEDVKVDLRTTMGRKMGTQKERKAKDGSVEVNQKEWKKENKDRTWKE